MHAMRHELGGMQSLAMSHKTKPTANFSTWRITPPCHALVGTLVGHSLRHVHDDALAQTATLLQASPYYSNVLVEVSTEQ